MQGKSVLMKVTGILLFLILLCIGACFTILIRAFLLQRKRPLSELYRQRVQQPDFCPYDRIPERLRFFILQTEDDGFFSHRGYLYQGIVDAIHINRNARKIVCGGSTITQQLVKNLYFRFNHSYFRKLAELIIALRAEKVLGKEKILELYLNIIYFGNGEYGIVDASRFYFSVDPEHLTENQMLMLACIPHAPTAGNPLKHPDVYARIRDQKLALMKRRGTLSDREIAEFSAYSMSRLDPQLRPRDAETDSFPDAVVLINERFGPRSGWPQSAKART